MKMFVLLFVSVLLSAAVVITAPQPIQPTLENGRLVVSWYAHENSISTVFLVRNGRSTPLHTTCHNQFRQTGSIDAAFHVQPNDTIRIVVWNSAGNITNRYEGIVKYRIYFPWLRT
jgi:hypothetical protein